MAYSGYTIEQIEDAIVAALEADGTLSGYVKTFDRLPWERSDEVEKLIRRYPALLVTYAGGDDDNAVNAVCDHRGRFSVWCCAKNLRSPSAAARGPVSGEKGVYDLIHDTLSCLNFVDLGTSILSCTGAKVQPLAASPRVTVFACEFEVVWRRYYTDGNITWQVPDILSVDDAAVSGTPKVLRFWHWGQWYYTKAYPVISAELNGSGDDAGPSCYTLEDTALSGSPALIAFVSGGSTYYVKGYPIAAGLNHCCGDINLAITLYGDAAMSGTPRVLKMVIDGTPFYTKAYPTKARGDKPMLIQKSQVACEIEAVEGTAETLVAADAFLCFNPKFTPSIEAHERNPVRSNLSPYPSAMGRRQATLEFDVELVGTSGAGDAIHYSDALQGCGVSETLSASTSATYKPDSSSPPSVTIALYMDGKCYKLWGARGTARLDLEAGKPGMIHMIFTGADFSESDAALLSGVSYNDIMPPAFLSASLTIDSYSANVGKVSLDLGNTVTLREDASEASGHESAVITERKPTLSFDPENVLVASEDFLGNWRSGSEMAFSMSIGSDAGNTIGITAPKIQYQDVAMNDRKGWSIYDISGLCVGDSGDDEWQVQIT